MNLPSGLHFVESTAPSSLWPLLHFCPIQVDGDDAEASGVKEGEDQLGHDFDGENSEDHDGLEIIQLEDDGVPPGGEGGVQFRNRVPSDDGNGAFTYENGGLVDDGTGGSGQGYYEVDESEESAVFLGDGRTWEGDVDPGASSSSGPEERLQEMMGENGVRVSKRGFEESSRGHSWDDSVTDDEVPSVSADVSDIPWDTEEAGDGDRAPFSRSGSALGAAAGTTLASLTLPLSSSGYRCALGDSRMGYRRRLRRVR